MSYCDFNNAFKNMNDKFLQTFDGITSEDLLFNKVNSEDFSFDDKQVQNRVQSNITRSGEYLNGTSIQQLNNINKNNNFYSNRNVNLNNNKLTHRQCIYLYLNPINNNNPNYQIANRHIAICSICQNEINKKVKESFQMVNSNDNLSSTQDITNAAVLDNTNTVVQDKTNTVVQGKTNTVVQDKTNTSIQDVNVANRTSAIQSNVNSVSTQSKVNSVSAQSNGNPENKVVSLSMSELDVLLKNITDRSSNDRYENFSRIMQRFDENEQNKPLCIELNFMNIAICLLIILLLIDIVLRLKK
jgi:hypothetical protein